MIIFEFTHSHLTYTHSQYGSVQKSMQSPHYVLYSSDLCCFRSCYIQANYRHLNSLSEWRYCSWCECNAPPRSFHCHVCKVCILRRDHHCIFTGNCIGYNNHRYYMLLLLYTWVASIYSNVMNFNYIWYTVGDFSFVALLKLIFPFFSWIIRQIDFITMVTTALLLLSIAVSVTITALMVYHLQNAYFGQITYERSHKIFKYNIGWKNNVKAVFGKSWKFGWICPLISSELPHNGQTFPIAGQYEEPKYL